MPFNRPIFNWFLSNIKQFHKKPHLLDDDWSAAGGHLLDEHGARSAWPCALRAGPGRPHGQLGPSAPLALGRLIAVIVVGQVDDALTGAARLAGDGAHHCGRGPYTRHHRVAPDQLGARHEDAVTLNMQWLTFGGRLAATPLLVEQVAHRRAHTHLGTGKGGMKD